MKAEVVNSFKNLNGYTLHKNCSNTNHPCAFYFPYMSLFPSGCYKLNHYFCHPVMILFYLHGYISCVMCQWNFLMYLFIISIRVCACVCEMSLCFLYHFSAMLLFFSLIYINSSYIDVLQI